MDDNLLGEEKITHDFPQISSWFLNVGVNIPDALDLNQFVYVYAVIDTASEVPETDEGNNKSEIKDAAVALVYDDENASRFYDIVIETYSPKDPDTEVDAALTLFSSEGTMLVSDETVIHYYSNSPDNTLYILVSNADDPGPYALSVRTSNIELKEFPNIVSPDPFEPDDDHSGNIPANPLVLNTNNFCNRFAENESDLDWFEIYLP